MHGYAQTCPQLFQQLIAQGYPNSGLEQVHRSYGVAMRLFAGWYRSSGKTFLSLSVGTGSILAAHGQPAAVVAAGVLHAAYTNGDFGDGLGWPTPGRRRALAREAGEDVEEYVAAYSARSWEPAQIPVILEQIPAMDARAKTVLLMRLANEMEEYLDAGLAFCGESKQGDYAKHSGAVIVECARQLGYPALAAELESAQESIRQVSLPAVLRPWADTGSFQVIPKSCGHTARVRGVRLLRAAKRRLFS